MKINSCLPHVSIIVLIKLAEEQRNVLNWVKYSHAYHNLPELIYIYFTRSSSIKKSKSTLKIEIRADCKILFQFFNRFFWRYDLSQDQNELSKMVQYWVILIFAESLLCFDFQSVFFSFTPSCSFIIEFI